MKRRKEYIRAGGRVIDDVPLVPKGYQKITGLGTVKSLTVPAGAVYAEISVETQDVRWRDDGINPTVTDGMPLVAGQSMEYDADLEAIKFIETAASAVIHVAYYGLGSVT